MALKKKIPYFILAGLAGLLSGFDTAISGGMLALTAFLKSFFPKIYEQTRNKLPSGFCQYSNATLIAISVIPYGLGMFFGFFSIWLQLRLGLKKLLIASTLLVAVGGTISVIDPHDFKVFLSGRILLGIGLAVFRQVVPNYLRDVPPRECRELLDIVYDQSTNLGTLLGSLMVIYEFGNSNSQVWRLMAVPAILLAIILSVLSCLIPESPLYLMICGKLDMANQSLEKILDQDQVQQELDRVTAEANILQEVNLFLELCKRSSRPQLIIHVSSFLFRSFMGASTFLLFLPAFLAGTGLGKNVALSASLCTNITSLVVGVISAVLIGYFKFGRRRIILVGCGIVVSMQLVLGILLFKFLKPEETLNNLSKSTTIVFMCLLIAGTTLVVNPMGWLSQSYPGTAHSVGSVFSRNTNPTVDFVLMIWFLHLICSMQAALFFVFMAVTILASLFVFFLLPRGLPDEDMNQQWIDHPIWGMYVVHAQN